MPERNIEDEFMTGMAVIVNTLEKLEIGATYEALQKERGVYYNWPKNELKQSLIMLAHGALELYLKLR